MHQARTPAKDPARVASVRHRLFAGRTAAADSLKSPKAASRTPPTTKTYKSRAHPGRVAKETVQPRGSGRGVAHHTEVVIHTPSKGTKEVVTSVQDATLVCDAASVTGVPVSLVTPDRRVRCPASEAHDDSPASILPDTMADSQGTPVNQLTRQRRCLLDSVEEASHVPLPIDNAAGTQVPTLGNSPPTPLSLTLAGTAMLPASTAPHIQNDVNMYTPDRHAIARRAESDRGAAGTADTDAADMSSAGDTPVPFPITPQRPVQVRFFRSSKALLQDMPEDPFRAHFPSGGVGLSPRDGALFCVGQLPAESEAGSDGESEEADDKLAAVSRGEVRAAPAGGAAASLAEALHVPRAFSVNATLQDEDDWPSHNSSLRDNGVVEKRSGVHSPAPSRVVSPALSAEAEPPLLGVHEASPALAQTEAPDGQPGEKSPPAQPPLEGDATAMPAVAAASSAADAPARDRRGSANSTLTLSHVQLEKHTPDDTREACKHGTSESGEPAESAPRSSPSATRPDSCKRASPSSGRGMSGSLGCTDANCNSRASREQRSPTTPHCEVRAESEDRDSCEAASGEKVQTEKKANHDDGCVVIQHDIAPLGGLTIDDVAMVVGRAAADRIRVPADAEGAPHHSSAAEGDVAVTVPAERHPCRDTTSPPGSLTPAGVVGAPLPPGPWSSALHSGQALVAEHQLEVLNAFMTAQHQAAAWLPPIPLTGLGSVTAHAHTPTAATAPPRASESPEAPPPQSELQLLFNLYCSSSRASPSHLGATAEALCAAYFAMQMRRYDNWVHHLHFEFLYARMVAVPALEMMELHQRRLICMQRDLGVRNAIELFVLLAPRPRAPTASTGRGIFSTFRMALHALTRTSDSTGNEKRAAAPPPSARSNSERRTSRSSSKEAAARTANSTAKALIASQRPPSQSRQPGKKTEATPSTGPAAAGQPPSTEVEGRNRRPARIEPLLAMEHRARTASSNPVVTETDTNAVGSVVPKSLPESKSVVRRRVDEPAPRRESVSRHRGAPQPERTGSDDASRKTEKNAGSAKLAPPSGTWLPQIRRASLRPKSRGSLSARRRSVSPASRVTDSAPSTGKPPKPSKVRELRNGGLRAKERVVATQRDRTPPPSPTDADFVDLTDAAVLDRLVR